MGREVEIRRPKVGETGWEEREECRRKKREEK